MSGKLTVVDLLFEIKDVLGRKIRTTKTYWEKITTLKHKGLKYNIAAVKKVLKSPDEVRESLTDETILIFAKIVAEYAILVVAVKILNGEGFLVTVYQTKKYKKKGKLIWPKSKKLRE